MPMVARSMAKSGNSETNRVIMRGCATESLTMFSMLEIFEIGRLRSSSAILARTAGTSIDGLALERTSRVIDGYGICSTGTYSCSTLAEFRAVNFISATTPTTSRAMLSRDPTMCLPNGFWFGQKCLAAVWLTIVTDKPPALSLALNRRPSNKGVFTASKYPSLTCQKAKIGRASCRERVEHDAVD